jgi:hypothetical protein
MILFIVGCLIVCIVIGVRVQRFGMKEAVIVALVAIAQTAYIAYKMFTMDQPPLR